jgi:hypothetical protein
LESGPRLEVVVNQVRTSDAVAKPAFHSALAFIASFTLSGQVTGLDWIGEEKKKKKKS